MMHSYYTQVCTCELTFGEGDKDSKMLESSFSRPQPPPPPPPQDVSFSLKAKIAKGEGTPILAGGRDTPDRIGVPLARLGYPLPRPG